MPNFPTPVRPIRKKLQVPVRYRVDSDARWQTGQTENISHTGVLFRANTPVALHATVELVLTLPSWFFDAAPTELVCAGKVKRVVKGDVHGHPAIGVAFLSMASETIDALLLRL